MKDKRLFRSTEDKMIAGVCGGLGEYFAIDPVIFRVIFVASLLLNGAGAVLYIILAIVIPEKATVSGAGKTTSDKDEKTATSKAVIKHRGNVSGGMVLIAAGALLLMNNILPQYRWADWWPLLVVAAGLGMLWPRKSETSK